MKEIWTRFLVWLGHPRPIRDWQTEMLWINRGAKRKSGHWAIVTCVFGMLVYIVWSESKLIEYAEK